MGIICSICPFSKRNLIQEDNSQQRQSLINPQPQGYQSQMITSIQNNNNNIIIDDDINDDQPIEEKYIIEKKLSEGSFGSSYLAIFKSTGENRIVQIYHKKPGLDHTNIKQLIRPEYTLLKSLSHPSLLKVYDLYETSTDLIIVNDYSEGKELFETIYKQKTLKEEMAAIIMHQLLNAVAYCHSKGVIHRDLRTETILLETDTLSGSIRIKVLDVGIAMMTSKGRFGNKVNSASFYIAPEVIDMKYSHACDLWSCGVILYSMLSGRLPFNANNNKDLYDKIQLGQYDTVKPPFDRISIEAIDLISNLLRLQPNQRLTAIGALDHIWFKKLQIHKQYSSSSISSYFNNNSMKYLFSLINLNLQKTPLKHSTIGFLIRHLPNLDIVIEARRFFNQFNSKYKGYLSGKEFVIGLSQLIKKNDIISFQHYFEGIFAGIDKENKGLLSLDEFLIMTINPKRLIKEINLKEVFNLLIKDKNDQVLLEYLRSVISKGDALFPSHEFTYIAAHIDINKSGKLTFSEFVQLIVKIITLA